MYPCLCLRILVHIVIIFDRLRQASPYCELTETRKPAKKQLHGVEEDLGSAADEKLRHC